MQVLKALCVKKRATPRRGPSLVFAHVCIMGWLTVRAVDDTKNHLTYFVRVDWHLPGRELSRMSEVAVVFAHVCIMGWHG